MNVNRVFSVSKHPLYTDIALMTMRVVGGLAFVLHGWGKIQNPFGWMGPDGFAPGIFQALAAISEFGGGIAWILGIVTPLASLGIASTMAVAFCFHAFLRGDPFVPAGPGSPSSELAAVYFCVAVLLTAMGPGRISLDQQFFGRR